MHRHNMKATHRKCRHPVVNVDRRIRWHYTTTILRLRIDARLTRYRNCKFHNFARTISQHADGISRYSVPPSASPLLPLPSSTCESTDYREDYSITNMTIKIWQKMIETCQVVQEVGATCDCKQHHPKLCSTDLHQHTIFMSNCT